MRKMELAALRPAAIRTVGRQLATFCVGFSLAILSSMVFRKQIEGLDKTAPELRGLPLKPLTERAVALDSGVAGPNV
jgi:hypothetical protein